MIRGTGTDIIEINRIKKAAEKSDAFCSRIYTAGEIADCKGAKIRWSSLAARFAAKEAVAKALGTGIGKVRWTDIEIIKNDLGKPQALLHNAAAAIAKETGITNISISLSHCEAYAVAFAVAY